MKNYTIKEACDILKLSKFSIRNYIKSGDLKAVKIGRQYVITEEALKEFMASRQK